MRDLDALVRELRDSDAVERLIGRAPAFLRAIACLSRIASAQGSVLLEGETGTGKELVARAIHYSSPRAQYPFFSLNCAALPETLIEDELFGHERGAFTDAQTTRRGLIAEAGSGTVFLDEIDSLSWKGQSVLLRLLQNRAYRPLGSVREVTSVARFVCASNTPILDLVARRQFRQDLYYRISVFSIMLPPLRERGDDILPLALHFIAKHGEGRSPLPGLSAAAKTALLTWNWPGNVRELENAIIRAVQLADGPTIEPTHLLLRDAPASATAGSRPGENYAVLKARVLEQFEKDYLTRLMSECAGNISQAARVAGKERRDLRRLLRKHRIDPSLHVDKVTPTP
jgi:DNA-binding NtrC family response regulator